MQIYFFNVLESTELAIEKGLVISYHSVSSHGKGVDAMSGFDVKYTLRKAVLIEDFHYDCVNYVFLFLSEHSCDDSSKKYYE